MQGSIINLRPNTHTSSPRTTIASRSTSTSTTAPARPSKRVLGKSTRERLLASNLLTANEAIDSDGNGAIDVRRAAELAEAHLGKGLADAEDGL